MDIHKRWLTYFFVLFSGMLISIVSWNVFMDPLWLFGHAHRFNEVQDGFNERLLKTNQMTFQPFAYDDLLLGNSRVTLVNQNEFHGMHVYNYAVSGLKINEISSMIAYAKQVRGKEFEHIIIGIDINQMFNKTSEIPVDPDLSRFDDPLYRLKASLSFDTLLDSYINFRETERNPKWAYRKYNRYNVATPPTQKNIPRGGWRTPKKEYLLKDFRNNYNPNMKSIYAQWKKENPNTSFIVFTNPLPSENLHFMVEQGKMEAYKRYLRDMVEVFGTVYHFQYNHSVAKNRENFYNYEHYYEQIGTMIAHRIVNEPDSSISEDFGIILTRQNIESYLATINLN